MNIRTTLLRGIAVLLLVAELSAAESLSAWRHSRSVNLDTSPTGADIQGAVENFPLAIRLNSQNFNFSQTHPGGADIRFAAGGTLLIHAIEHWDSARKTALVWVKLPKILGAAKTQTILMHWGNPSAPDVSNARAVFPVSEGWVGVWHLDDETSTALDGFKDSTANEAHGAGQNFAGPGGRVEGRVGYGLSLNYASNQWVSIAGEKRKLFDLTNRLTFSIWAKARSYSNKGDSARRALPGYETMFAKGDNSWRLQKFGIATWHKPPANLIEICVEQRMPRADLCVVGATDMATNQWFHFVGVHEHPEARLYVNGRLDKIENFPTEWSSGDHPVGIGNQSQFPQQGRNWDGILDEARVLGVVKDEHWIKLDYESQREGQKLVSFGETKSSH